MMMMNTAKHWQDGFETAKHCRIRLWDPLEQFLKPFQRRSLEREIYYKRKNKCRKLCRNQYEE